MINNPMTSDFVKERIGDYPETLQHVFNAVNGYAYDTCSPIETRLGEYCPDGAFDYDVLVNETKRRIWNNLKEAANTYGIMLCRALQNAALTNHDLDSILVITEQEAVRRIDQATSDDRKSFREHGHHGRQYIARNSVERVMKEVLPLAP